MSYTDSEAERYRTGDPYINSDRACIGLTELHECDECEAGIVEREVEDMTDSGVACYKAVNGSGFDSLTRSWMCPACYAKRTG
jgi:rubredoxin